MKNNVNSSGPCALLVLSFIVARIGGVKTEIVNNNSNGKPTPQHSLPAARTYVTDTSTINNPQQQTTQKPPSAIPQKPHHPKPLGSVFSTEPVEEDSCPTITGLYVDDLSTDEFSSRLTDGCRYDRLTMPKTNLPMEVYLQTDIRHIEAVEQLQFRLHMLLQYRYIDNRLSYKDVSPNRGVMMGEDLLRDKIWIPHIVLSNEKSSAIMGLEGKDVYVSISPQGEIIFSYRMAVTIYCWMNLMKFPFDTQECDITFTSWTYNASKVILKWEDDKPVEVASQLHLTEFALVNYTTFSKLDSAQFSKNAYAGNFSAVVFRFKLEREIGYYVLDYFIPSIMLVSCSWVTFWLQADNAAPRITLGTSTMLSFITLAGGQTKNLPKVSYIKASEIWFLGCTLFIFGSMVEFAFVNIIWRRKKKVELKKVNSKYILKSTLTPSLARKQLQKASSINNLHKSHSCSSLETCNDNMDIGKHKTYDNYLTVHSFPSTILPTITTQSEDDLMGPDSRHNVAIPVPNSRQDTNNISTQRFTSMTPQEVAIWIDRRSRIVFPVAFLIFNIIYWSFVYAL